MTDDDRQDESDETDTSTQDYRVEEFHILQHQRRKRLILVLLLLPRRSVSITFLAEFLAVLQTGDRPRRLSSADYNRTRQSLLKSHLNPLETAGVIDTNGNTITPGPAFLRYAVLALAQEVLMRGALLDTG